MSDVYGVAREYGRALFMLTEEVGSSERVREEALGLVRLFDSNPEYSKMLDTPALSPDERIALVGETLNILQQKLHQANSVSEQTFHYLRQRLNI